MLTLDFFRDPAEAERVAAGLADGSLDPWQEKRRLAREVVELYGGPGEGDRAEARFDLVHKDRLIPDEVPQAEIPADAIREGAVWLPRLLVAFELAGSNAEARRLIEQGGIRLDGERVLDAETEMAVDQLRGKVLQAGRRSFIRLR
jgi:tyrosyl-tRNA synthetase